MKRLLWICIITLVLLFVSKGLILYFLPLKPLKPEMSSSQAIFDSQHKLLRLTLSNDDKFRLYTPLSEISPTLIATTLLKEDQYFYSHPGVNPFALLRASLQTYLLKVRRIGASTITMQVARMRYGINSKTFFGKLEQIIKALQIEMQYTKNQILEAYLNLASYGNNIEGVGAASLIYFDKEAHDLNLLESLTLAVLPQNPTKRSLDQKKLKESRDKLFEQWIAIHPQDKDQQSLITLPLKIRNLQSLPYLAPHFVNHVLGERQFNQKSKIVTTLDLRMQHMIETIIKNTIARKANLGVSNAAIMVIDSRDMSIKAEIGSADFNLQNISGQINGTTIKRSPGSTLKPFIYALAIDQGLIHPNTLLKDVPHRFGYYNPENFDHDFMGPIKAKDALVLSRNVPAISLANQLKNPTLYAFLSEAGISNLKAESYYGLALALGGAEMSMQELVALYAVFANDGILQPLRLSEDTPLSRGKRLFSREASFLVIDMLKNTEPPQDAYQFSRSKSRTVAFKTGTSSGFRDAWTMGIFGPYVIAVWLGNFNNESNHAFIGKELAAPLFFAVISAIEAQYQPFVSVKNDIPSKGLNLTKVKVCKVSGMLPTRYCKEQESVWFIPGKSPIKQDTLHREVAINSQTGLRTCHFNQHTRFEIYEFWPSDVGYIFDQAKFTRNRPKAYEDNCESMARTSIGLSPQITSPETSVKYISRIGDEHTLIPLSAVVDADVKYLYWFVNETFIAKTKNNEPYLWHGRRGKYIIRIVDDHGRSDAKDVEITLE